jgi:hypothetical protein
MTVVQGLLLAVSSGYLHLPLRGDVQAGLVLKAAMSDFILIAILVIFFALAIGLVRVLGAMIDRDTDPDAFREEEPPDTSGPVQQAGWRQ